MATNAQSTPEGINIGDDSKGKDLRQMCKYGDKCYQKNPMHHQKFRHPQKDLSVPDLQSNQLEDLGSKENVNINNKITIDTVKNKKEKETDTEPVTKKLKYCDEQGPSEIVEEKVNESADKSCVKDCIPSMSKWASDPKKRIDTAFSGRIQMPEDFYEFYEFCFTLNRDNPLEALVPTCGLKLVGPFEFLLAPPVRNAEAKVLDISKTCMLETRSQNDLYCHWRYKYDPPEFQTVLASSEVTNTFHIGYFRDDPKEMPAFVASSGGKKCEETFSNGLSSYVKLTQMGDNLFGTVYNHIQKLIQTAEPFKQTALQKMKGALHVHATIKTQEIDYPLEVKTPRMKARDKKKLGSTFHGAGLVVPYNKETELGYREIPETTQSLKRILNNIIEAQKKNDEQAKNKAFDVLQELVTNVQFANDEGDPGMGLELGLNAFMYCSRPLDSTVKHLLSVAYELLDRDLYGKILLAHLSRRCLNEDMFKAK